MAKFQDKLTQLWVKITGRRIDQNTHDWLIGPIGEDNIIEDKFIYSLAEKGNLDIYRNTLNSGLLQTIDQLGFSAEEKKRLNPLVIEFYEQTSNFDLEVWSTWRGLFKPFGKLISILFSKRLQQLNLPTNPLDVSKGISSEIIQLKDKTTHEIKWTIWFRKLKSTNDVIYSGIYTSCQNPNYNTPLLKVVFPLPNGNATVLMTKKIGVDGSLLLSSDGKKFGDNGFYFTLTDHKGKYWAKYVRPMHEWIKVYVDNENVLRADHNLNFLGLRFLELHYKMWRKN